MRFELKAFSAPAVPGKAFSLGLGGPTVIVIVSTTSLFKLLTILTAGRDHGLSLP